MLEVRVGRTAPTATVTVLPVAAGMASLPEALRAAAAADGFSGAAGTLCDTFSGSGRVLLVGLGAGPPSSYRRRQC